MESAAPDLVPHDESESAVVSDLLRGDVDVSEIDFRDSVPDSSATVVVVPKTLRNAHVVVPKTLRNAHVVAQSVLEKPTSFGLTKPVARRAALLLQGLITAMEERGWACSLSTERRRFAVVTYSSHKVEIGIKELNTRTDHIATKKELADVEKSSWRKVPEYDYTPDGRLQLTVGESLDQKKFADGKRVRLDERLGRAIDDIQRRFVEDEERRTYWQREAELSEARRLKAMERAVELHREAARLSVLNAEVTAWQQAAQMRAYACALDEQFGDGAAEWTEWIRNKADAIDPLKSVSHPVPSVPAASPNELIPYLPAGVSPWR